MLNSKLLMWSLLLIWIAGSVYWHVCKIKNLCDIEIAVFADTPAQVSKPIAPLIIIDTPGIMLQSRGNFTFAKNGIMPDKSNVYPELDSLAVYLETNKNKHLIITGYYQPDETNTTIFPDLGIARATEIKNWFLGKGIPDSVFEITSKPSGNIQSKNDSLTGGIAFSFPNKKTDLPTDLANSQKFEIIFKPIDLYFPTAGTAYIKTEENQSFILAVKEFFSKNADKKLVLTGHTDDEDSAEWNLKLSKRRAVFVKNQLSAFGISPERMIAEGKGESEPKLPNTTPEGKRANRRVTIVVR